MSWRCNAHTHKPSHYEEKKNKKKTYKDKVEERKEKPLTLALGADVILFSLRSKKGFIISVKLRVQQASGRIASSGYNKFPDFCGPGVTSRGKNLITFRFGWLIPFFRGLDRQISFPPSSDIFAFFFVCCVSVTSGIVRNPSYPGARVRQRGDTSEAFWEKRAGIIITTPFVSSGSEI